MALSLRRIRAGEAGLYREIRLRALKNSPQAFGTKYDDALKRSRDVWVEQADRGAAPNRHCAHFFLLQGCGEMQNVVGLVSLYQSPQVPERAHLCSLWIEENVRGGGGGLMLCQCVIDFAREQRYRILHTEATPHNKRVEHLYERLGFQRVVDQDQEDNRNSCFQIHFNTTI